MATVPDVAVENTAKLLGGVSGGQAYTLFAVGTGTAAESTDDTALDTELTTGGFERATATATYESTGDKCVLSHLFTNTGATAVTITEMGAFTTSGILGIRHLLAVPIEVPAGQTYLGTLKIPVTQAA